MVMQIAHLLGLVALLCVLAAAVCDLRRFEIPDGLSIAIVVLFIGYAFVTPPSVSWLSALSALALTFAIGVLLFWLGWMGGGDAKLLPAIALWTGLGGLPVLLMGTAIAGGVLAVVLLALRALPVAAGSTPESRPRVLRPGEPLPYGVAIAAGTLLWAWQQFGSGL